MDGRKTGALLSGLAAIALLAAGRMFPQTGGAAAAIAVDYPEDGSLFPPEIAAPEFQWRDAAETATAWEIAIVFSDGAAPIRTRTSGGRMQVGEIDPRCVSPTNELPRLTALQAAAHTWRPGAETWAAVRGHAVERPAEVTIVGWAAGNPSPVSRGRVSIQISRDPVGAPIFYRDVPLMPSVGERGAIKPLSPAAVPLIGWRLRDIGESASRLVLENLPTCANCHSFSADGKTMGIDVDGPDNDKGTYAIAAIAPHMSIRREDVITWNSFPGKTPGLNTLGFMAQVSPDGRYAVTTLNEQVYVANFKDYRFLQVFYPTRGILGWFRRSDGRMEALAGADDPRYVQTGAAWSPDGKYLVFARAEARDAYPPGRPMATFANDPNEPQIQFDLYRIPFNEGKGGRAEPIAGAAHNGMSNSFPKVSPDGRWIVFVQCRNGLLMRPDSRLFIVPSGGGEARPMRCNTALMNSWHSFSPNGRWLVFSSKSRSPYTQMFLTHIGEDGRDSPPIFVENSTAANRAVNIPEFVNIAAGGIAKIEVPAADFYKLFDSVVKLGDEGRWEAAVAGWRQVLEIEPDNAKAHSNLGAALARRGAFDEAIAHLRTAIGLKPGFDRAHFNLGIVLYQAGDLDGAIAQWRETVALNPDFAEAYNLEGVALTRKAKFDEAIRRFRLALELEPQSARTHYNLGLALAKTGAGEEAAAEWRKALEIDPNFAEAAAALRPTHLQPTQPSPRPPFR